MAGWQAGDFVGYQSTSLPPGDETHGGFRVDTTPPFLKKLP